MTTANHYKSNLRDIFFNLFEVLEINKNVFGKAPYANLDEATARETLRAFETVCQEKIATSFVEADRVPLKLDDNGNVHLPEGLKKSILDFYAGDWHLLNVPEELGGFGFSESIYWAGCELMFGANAVAGFYLFGIFAANIINTLGTEEQKKRYIRNIIDRHWGATMVLTEPDAGSDVGSGRAKARYAGNGEWHIEGVKRFITNGDFDCTENIVHMVLARPEGHESGTKGLSMFLVPKFWVNEDGSTGERNGVFCTNIEKKMGIKGSSTAELTFGEKMPARGLLLGEVHDGIKQMFKVIEKARMAVGVKSMSTLSTAYLNSLEFAKDRVQGPDMLKAMDKNSPRVTIINHPDVKRMLMLQKSTAEGMRALAMYCSYLQDKLIIAQTAGNAEEAKQLHKLTDLVLPLIKGYNSEKVYELLATSLQVYGGSGYLQDYPIEQYIRDQKIDSLYEGTTHIQALDLIFRKIAKDGAQTLNVLLDEIRSTLQNKVSGDMLSFEYDSLQTALNESEAILMVMMGKLSESFYHAGFNGNRILFAIAELAIGWLLVRQAEVASAKIGSATAEDKDFYTGKLAATRFYCRNTLPNIGFVRQLIENNTLELMELPDIAY